MTSPTPTAAVSGRPPSEGVGAEASDPEGALLVATLRGDGEAREELARRLRRPAYHLALQLLGNPDDALDVAQDSMLRLFSTLDRFELGRPLEPWLFRIVRNRAIDLRRHRRVRPAVSLDGLLEAGAPVEAAPGGADGASPEPAGVRPSAGPGPLERIEARELRRRIWRGLSRLKAAHREILVLRDYQDLSYREIAEVLGIPSGTVMSRLHGARKALRTELLQDGFGDRRGSAREPISGEDR